MQTTREEIMKDLEERFRQDLEREYEIELTERFESCTIQNKKWPIKFTFFRFKGNDGVELVSLAGMCLLLEEHGYENGYKKIKQILKENGILEKEKTKQCTHRAR